MSSSIRNLIPANLWNFFADLNAVPRASKNEAKVIQFMLDFAQKLGLEATKDHVGNVLIRKSATFGMEGHKAVVLQSHLDMVHQKNQDTHFDFENQGIEMYVDGDWVKARGTTLGADNGIGVATIMAILAANDIPHPDLEALFTIDEETGMTGAMGLQAGFLSGEILLNLDTEEDDEIDIGCAGGLDVTASKTYLQETVDSNPYTGLKISIKGLNGGHSGMDIHKGLGNANKILGRLLFGCYEAYGLRIVSFEGGSLRNAIPREGNTRCIVPNNQYEGLLEYFNKSIVAIKKEYNTIDPQLEIGIEKEESPNKCMAVSDQEAFVKALIAAHNGVYRMSPDIKDLVEASNNVAKVQVKDGNMSILCLSRSSVESSKLDLANTLKAVFELAGMQVAFSGDYPGWTPNVDSPILKILTELYDKLFEQKAHVVACHAGLECGILGKNYPNMDMISFGPTIKGAHSPDERVSISSVQKFWKFTLEILKNIPKKNP